MSELEPQAGAEPTTVVIVLGGRQQRIELSPEIGGIGKAIEAWKKCGGQHRIFGEQVETETLSIFGDWLVEQRAARVVDDPV